MNIKKYTIVLVLSTFVVLGCQRVDVDDLSIIDQQTSITTDGTEYPDVFKGILRVRLSDQLGDELNINSEDGGLRSGNNELDVYLKGIGASSMTRVFPHAGKYEGRTRREGLHLWYDITFDPNTPMLRATNEAKNLPGVEIVEHIYLPQVSESRVQYADISQSVLRVAGEPFDDAGLPLQWHYNNRGENPSFVAGADVNLYEAWKIETGKPNVIVAIVDGGIDIHHEDLKDNLYVNEKELNGSIGVDDDDNGYVDDIYGFNFVDMSPNIAPHFHGTHVAGTVGARNNNGRGVAGVAGGNGDPNSGVRLMSCQIFMTVNGVSQGTANSPLAIKYAADNGASIAQNSWGYKYPGPSSIPSSLKDAIDYFIKYAGCDDKGNQLPDAPMKGGVVIFAAGNDYVDHPVQPGPYEPVIAVASFAPDFKVADYSNRGDWVDITAPGGSSFYAEGMVLSTVPGSKYGFLEGTSMATPHVSGIAALVLSKHGSQGYTADELKGALLNATRKEDINEINPKYVGRLGLGYIDAVKAFQRRTFVPPLSVTEAQVQGDLSGLKVTFKSTTDSDEAKGVAAFYDVYQSTKVLKSLSDLKGSTVTHREIRGLLVGANEELSTTYYNLKSNTQYYFAIVARDRWGNVSDPYFFSGWTAQNQAPVATLSDNNIIRLAGNMVKDVRITVDEPDGQNWTYEVSGDTYGVVIAQDNEGISLRLRAIAPVGFHLLVFTFTDPFGAQAEIKVPYVIYNNNAPRAVVASRITASLAEGIKVMTLSELFTDDDREPLTLEANVISGNMSAKIDNQNNLYLSTTTAGVSTLSLSATDPAGATVKKVIEVRFVDNEVVYAVYPIPATTTLNVDLAEAISSAKLEVFTTVGQRVLVREFTFGVSDSRGIALDISNVIPGTYTLHVTADGHKYTKTFVKR
ncbi:MAG: S8 family serine peptidase [Bacteroidales bacterium]|uniref:S8 family serine peptidase n=1 Tax=Porphyromonas sp. TaxID=1924944 RepID=UPI002971BA66|nr:S8 family serine peptidase [Porphyromonas sp.]MDD7438896.1 S8 family serine peptidase [Bacteroidales bacterium]MDY3067220.1 S8 family serine peptidase [Porphyromonas sp.]